MKVLEFEAKALLKELNLSVPLGKVAALPEEAEEVARDLAGPVVVKAQIPTGGRMKAGGIRFAGTPAEAVAAAKALLGQQILGRRVDYVLVEQKVQVSQEVYVGAIYDPDTHSATLLASKVGGIDVEENPQIIRRPVSVLTAIPEYIGCELASQLDFQGRNMLDLARIMTQLARYFIQIDALLLEINPLILDTEGRWWIADVHLELDEDAAYRQADLLQKLPSSIQLTQPRSDFERRAFDIDNADHRGVAGRLVAFEGDLGLLIGGGGASLTAFDAVLEAGLKPANYCEIGGNPSVWKISELTKLILSQPQVNRLAVIMNVVSNTRVDLVARGMIKGVLEMNLDPRQAIAAFRIPGSWEEEGQAILRHYGIPFFGRETSIDQVVAAIQ